MDEIDPRHRRDLVRLLVVVVVAVAAWAPLELVRRDALPQWVFLAYALLALGAALLTLPAAVRVFGRNRPADVDQRYWTVD